MLPTIILAILSGTASAYTTIVHKRFMIKNIDAIVFPGKYKSHMHSFYGSDTITKDLPTTEQLQKGCASGENPNDMSVYWIPSLYHVDGEQYHEVNPVMFSTYYENIGAAEIPFPPNFYAVAGNATGKSQNDVNEKVNRLTWWCENGPEDRNSRPRAAFPTVTCDTHIQAILSFPDCVDPGDIKQHTYAAMNNGRCPSPMKRLPQLRFSIRYDLRKMIPGGWKGAPPLKLACGEIGNGYCMHGDFINGWYEDAAKNMLKATSSREFLQIDGEHGNGKAGTKCTPKDQDPKNGTSDYLTSLEMMHSNEVRV